MRFIKAKAASGIVGLAWLLGAWVTTGWAAEKTLLQEEFREAVANPGTYTITSATTWCAFHNRGGKIPAVKAPKSGEDFGGIEFAAQSQSTLLAASFPAVQLKNAGDYVRLSVTYLYLHGPTNPAPGFVAGLYNSNGMPLTSGSGDTPFKKDLQVGLDFPGYRVGKNPNAEAQDLIADKVMGISSPFPDKALLTSDSGVAMAARKPHELELKITLQSDGSFAVESGIDGRNFHATDAKASASAIHFDTVLLRPLATGFGESSGNNYVQILKVVVVTSGK